MKQDEKIRLTIETYNKDPNFFAEKFKGIGARKADIDRAFDLNTSKNSALLELGCGNGRDAEYILTKTDHYIGVDASSGLSDIAKKTLPDVDFRCEDMEKVDFPPNSFGVIFAFASFLHLPKESLGTMIEKCHHWLVEGGILYISVKHADNYEEKMVDDEVAPRYFYYYSADDIKELARDFSVSYETLTKKGKTVWLEIALKKVSHETSN